MVSVEVWINHRMAGSYSGEFCNDGGCFLILGVSGQKGGFMLRPLLTHPLKRLLKLKQSNLSMTLYQHKKKHAVLNAPVTYYRISRNKYRATSKRIYFWNHGPICHNSLCFFVFILRKSIKVAFQSPDTARHSLACLQKSNSPAVCRPKCTNMWQGHRGYCLRWL